MWCVCFDRVCTEASFGKDNLEASSTNEKSQSEDKEVVQEANTTVSPDGDTLDTKTETCKEAVPEKLSMPETTMSEDNKNNCEGEKKEDAISEKKDVSEAEPPDETCVKNNSGMTTKKSKDNKDSKDSKGKDNNQTDNPDSVAKDVEKLNDAVTKKTNSKEKEHVIDQSTKKVDIPKAATNVNGIGSEKVLKPIVDNSNSDSDKENGDCPMDLSTGNKVASESSPDVIMLSDDDIDMSNDITKLELTPQQLKERRHLVKRLKEELRNEDAKLVLLKKIRQSQLMQHLHDAVPATNKQVSRHQTQTVPPPLVRSGLQQQQQQQQLAHSKVNAHTNSSIQMMRGPAHTSHTRTLPATHAQQGPPPLIMAPRHSAPNSAAPMGILGLRGLSTNSQQNLISGYRQQVAPVVPEQTPAQRQAAAKLALRKQLEKTLLQIPPPKPPPPEMNFMPSLAGNEFIMLAGLEEVVKHIVDIDARARGEKRPEVKYVFNPFVCVQCGTDFTPVWKRDKPGSKSVICELCVTTNQKKALKQEHTNRLKSAFVKALQQEQEIEQRIQAQSTAAAAAAATVTTTGTAPLAHHSVAHTAAPMNLTTNFKPTTEQMRHHQNLIEAHQAQLRSGGPLAAFNPRMAFPFPASALTKADLQRQYLLDMIPRSMPGGTVLWRT
ncbi:hypothetical protein NP493_532g03040 [Ridgeia piscesae]|uniref:GATA-type domain-containing protein n=1 Tax=Ridgeia piscesae TaxID=27915 RepID=A0AAD9KWQ5_RIDPI|nr:hypothetical protein NP493_532g03040 [Ridgeia piscesae]